MPVTAVTTTLQEKIPSRIPPLDLIIYKYLRKDADAATQLERHLSNVEKVNSASVKRVESAIMFTDIAGSSAIFDNYGDDYGRAIVSIHNDIVSMVIDEYGEQLVKFTGDGALCSIKNCDRAVEIALRIVDQVRRHNRRYPLLKLDIKIGVNVGEVMKEKTDHYGSSVNLAARVCDMAGGNEIYVTGIVALRCQDEHSNYIFVPRGKHDIKGFSHQIPISEVCTPSV